MEYDINELAAKLNVLEDARQEVLKQMEELRSGIKEFKVDNNDDMEANNASLERILKDNTRISRNLKKLQSRYDSIFDAQIDLSKIQNNMFKEVSEINKEIESLEDDIKKIDFISKKSSSISGSSDIQTDFENLKQEKLNKIQQLKEKKQCYFDKNSVIETKFEEPTIETEPIKQEESVQEKETKDVPDIKDDFTNLPNSLSETDLHNEESEEIPFDRPESSVRSDDEIPFDQPDEIAIEQAKKAAEAEETSNVVETKPATEKLKSIFKNRFNKKGSSSLKVVSTIGAVIGGFAALLAAGIPIATLLSASSLSLTTLLGGYIGTKSGVVKLGK